MTTKANTQANFFEQIRDRIPKHLSLVDELAELLEVSTDSAYRRIRGETSCTFEEIGMLAAKFNISLDAFFQADTHLVPFSYQALNEVDFNFSHYLQSIITDLEMIIGFEEKSIIYQANDLPFFHLLEAPEIVSFKLFFWEKTLLDFKSRQDQRFHLKSLSQDILDQSQQIRALYCQIPTTEIYDAEAVNYTLKQIEYYHVSGLFENSGDALVLCDKLEVAVMHMEKQARYGRKFMGQNIPEAWKEGSGNNYKLYYNEVMHSDNTFLVKAGPNKITYRTNNGLDALSTTSTSFFDATQKAVNVLMRRSTLISGTSEKERNKLFLSFKKRIEAVRQLVG